MFNRQGEMIMATAIETAYIDAEVDMSESEDAGLQVIEEAERHAAEAMATLNPQHYEALIMPGMSMDKMLERQAMIETLVTTLLTKDVHFGKIPGTQETSLWLRGAVVFKTFFGFDVQFQCVSQERERGAVDQDGVRFPWIYYCYKAVLYRGNQRLGEYEASANSYEPCFRYVWVERPKPSEDVIAEMQAEGTGKFIKKWDDDAKRSIPNWHVRRDHPNIMSLDNSIRQRAEKRAMVKVIDHATSAGAYLVKQEKESRGGSGYQAAGNKTKAADLPNEFWKRARATNFMQEAAPIAEKAKSGEITWQDAINQLPPLDN